MKRGRDGTEIEEPEEPEGWTDEDRAKMRRDTGADLPVIIDGPGWYRTRAGKRARIDRVRPGTQATGNCAGYLFVQEKTASKPAKTEWNIWRQNGRWKFLGEHPKDIVSKA